MSQEELNPEYLTVNISGGGPQDQLSFVIEAGETVMVGRSSHCHWTIPWDSRVSREHAKFRFQQRQLEVALLPRARNNVLYQNKRLRELSVKPGETFRIGRTLFQVGEISKRPPEADPDEADDVEFQDHKVESEVSYSANQLRNVSFSHSDRQLEILSRLPEMISCTASDNELGESLSQLLLDAIPQATAVAVAQFDESKLPVSHRKLDLFPKPETMRVVLRQNFHGRFLPSRRLILQALREQSSVVHILGQEDNLSDVTMTEGLGWAFCCPISGDSSQGWCLYVSGQGSSSGGLIIEQKDIAGDLRFTQLVAQFIGAIREVRLLESQKSHLSTYFSPKVIDRLIAGANENSLKPAEQDVTVLFCDVRGFSARSEKMQHDLPALLESVSAALEVMSSEILEQEGVIADFQGDAALGFWGWPTPLKIGPLPACVAAMNIFRRFRQAFEQQGHLLEGFSVGIGISHGRALAGQIGTNRQAKVGVFGPVVNQGSRLEGMTKIFGTPICLDEATAKYVAETMDENLGRIRKLARVTPQGMQQPVTVFALLPPEAELPSLTNQMLSDYNAAVEAVIAGDWNQAWQLLRTFPAQDRPALLLKEFMQRHRNRSPEDWDGVISLPAK